MYETRRYYLPKGVIKLITSSSMEKSFYDQPIDCDVKRYEEMIELTTRQGEGYTTGCLVDYDYIKNNCRLTSVDLVKI